MAKLYSFASWNIEHFSGKQDRFDRVVQFLVDVGTPDVFAIHEVRSSGVVFNEFTSRMPDHQFFITVTPNSPMDILVGVNRKFTAFYEQRTELQSGMPSLRPGALVTIKAGGENHTLLFLHLKAMDKPVGWGLRDDMVHHIRNLKKALDGGAPSGSANFIAMGDYNNVGLNVTFAGNDMSDDEELARYEKVMEARKMVLVPKDINETLWNGPGSSQPPADADHAFAADHLKIRNGNGGDGLRVRGWPEEPTPAKKGKWINELSDHALLYGEVHS